MNKIFGWVVQKIGWVIQNSWVSWLKTWVSWSRIWVSWPIFIWVSWFLGELSWYHLYRHIIIHSLNNIHKIFPFYFRSDLLPGFGRPPARVHASSACAGHHAIGRVRLCHHRALSQRGVGRLLMEQRYTRFSQSIVIFKKRRISLTRTRITRITLLLEIFQSSNFFVTI